MMKTRELKNFKYAGHTHIGNVRNENEDAFEYIETVNGSVFIVCDGMGGVKGGKLAAETAVSEIKRFISEEWFEDPKDLLTESIIRANNRVHELFPDALIKAGTTVVVALIRQNTIWYAHAGDSRLYYFTGKKLFQLTKDHSYVSELLDQKKISQEEALIHPRKNEITKALGTNDFIDPTICNSPLEPADSDYLLLCTDGLTNELTNKEISDILADDADVEEKCEELKDKALEKGGLDNITVQLLNFYNTGKNQNPYFNVSESEHEKTKKYKMITVIFVLIIAVIIVFLITEFIGKGDSIKVENTVMSNLPVRVNDNKDTLAEIFIPFGITAEQVANRFHTDLNEIGHVSGNTNSPFSKYYIPVKSICTYGISSCLLMYPEADKERMIDLLIVNNKNELYFSPGEIFIIPKE